MSEKLFESSVSTEQEKLYVTEYAQLQNEVRSSQKEKSNKMNSQEEPTNYEMYLLGILSDVAIDMKLDIQNAGKEDLALREARGDFKTSIKKNSEFGGYDVYLSTFGRDGFMTNIDDGQIDSETGKLYDSEVLFLRKQLKIAHLQNYAFWKAKKVFNIGDKDPFYAKGGDIILNDGYIKDTTLIKARDIELGDAEEWSRIWNNSRNFENK